MRKEDIIIQEGKNPLRSLWKHLQSLKSTISFMQTGAHPDDETSKLLAKISLGLGMHTIYINAVRGQGGQNAIGTERGSELGAIRTKELINAMELLRVDLGWLAETEDDTINDFGFSKSGDQTFEIWGEEHTLRQMVKMVRLFKPDIIIPTFLDVNGQHGHHRSITRTTIKAFEIANDSNFFSELNLAPWEITNLFLPAWGGGGGSYDDEEPPPEATHYINVGEYCSVMGGTFCQIGQWSRSFHATQGMGRIEHEENVVVPIHLLKSRDDRMNNNISGEKIPKNLKELSQYSFTTIGENALKEASENAEDAILNFPNEKQIMKSLIELSKLLKIAEKNIDPNHQHRITLKKKQCSLAMTENIALLPSLKFSSKFHFINKDFKSYLTIHNQTKFNLKNIQAELCLPFSKTIAVTKKDKVSSNRERFNFEGKINCKSTYSDLYQPIHSIFLDPKGVFAKFSFEINNELFSINVLPEENFIIIPEVTGFFEPKKIIHLKNHSICDYKVKLFNVLHSQETQKINLSTSKINLSNKIFEFKTFGSGKEIVNEFNINIPKNLDEGIYKIHASSNKQPIKNIKEIGYSHIGKFSFQEFSSLDILNVNCCSLRGLKVGWIDGSVDKAWKWAVELGADVKFLNDDDLLFGNLSEFDTIVSGVFAGLTRPLISAHSRLMAWMEQGGTYITEYQRPQDNWDIKKSSPYILEIGSPSIRWRVTDPNAKVKISDPNHILLNSPNKITLQDFNDWVKERGLYFASNWDKKYNTPLLMSDPGEKELKGSLLYAKVGLGCHIHCALNLFYQMDHLVPGSFRIFANLLSSHKE